MKQGIVFKKTALNMMAVFFCFSVLFIFIFLPLCFAQSSLEYAALITRQAAEAGGGDSQDAEKEAAPAAAANMATQAMDGIYRDSSGVLSQAGGKLKQIGSGRSGTRKPKATEVSKNSVSVPSSEPDTASEAVPTDGVAEVHLKNGKIVEGRFIQQGKGFVKIEIAGVVVTYFNEEIEKIIVPQE